MATDGAQHHNQPAGDGVDDDGEDRGALGVGLLRGKARRQLGIEGGDLGVQLLHQELA